MSLCDVCSKISTRGCDGCGKRFCPDCMDQLSDPLSTSISGTWFCVCCVENQSNLPPSCGFCDGPAGDSLCCLVCDRKCCVTCVTGMAVRDEGFVCDPCSKSYSGDGADSPLVQSADPELSDTSDVPSDTSDVPSDTSDVPSDTSDVDV